MAENLYLKCVENKAKVIRIIHHIFLLHLLLFRAVYSTATLLKKAIDFLSKSIIVYLLKTYSFLSSKK